MSVRKVIFVTDPLCSWCWGMAEAIETVRAALPGRVEFDLLLGGINIDAGTALAPGMLPRFEQIWTRVRAMTGQPFAMRFPESPNFVYNSLPQCRAIAAVRELVGRPPFAYLHALQRAFFVDAADTSAPDVLVAQARVEGVDEAALVRALASPDLDATLTLEMQVARSYGTTALPAVLVETEQGRRLLAGGYVDAPMLKEMIEAWLQRYPPVLN